MPNIKQLKKMLTELGYSGSVLDKNLQAFLSLGGSGSGSGTTYTFQAPLSVDGSNKVSIDLSGYVGTTFLNTILTGYTTTNLLGNEFRNAVEKNESLQNAIKGVTLPSIIAGTGISLSYKDTEKTLKIDATGGSGSGTTYATATNIRSLFNSVIFPFGNVGLVGGELDIDPATLKPKTQVLQDIDLDFKIMPLIPKYSFLVQGEQASAYLPDLTDIENLRFTLEGEVDVTIKQLLDAENYEPELPSSERGALYFDFDTIELINTSSSDLPLKVYSPLPVIGLEETLLNVDASGNFDPNVAIEIVPNSFFRFFFDGSKSSYNNGFGFYRIK